MNSGSSIVALLAPIDRMPLRFSFSIEALPSRWVSTWATSITGSILDQLKFTQADRHGADRDTEHLSQ